METFENFYLLWSIWTNVIIVRFFCFQAWCENSCKLQGDQKWFCKAETWSLDSYWDSLKKWPCVRCFDHWGTQALTIHSFQKKLWFAPAKRRSHPILCTHFYSLNLIPQGPVAYYQFYNRWSMFVSQMQETPSEKDKTIQWISRWVFINVPA